MVKVSKTGSQGKNCKWFCIDLSNSQTNSHKHYQENNDNEQNPMKFFEIGIVGFLSLGRWATGMEKSTQRYNTGDFPK